MHRPKFSRKPEEFAMTTLTRMFAIVTLGTAILATAPALAGGSVQGWYNGWNNGWMNGWSNGLSQGWSNGWNQGWSNGWNNGWMNGWNNGVGNGRSPEADGHALRVIGIELPSR